ncbi:zinc ribbon domain-containing protein [uncultured Methanoregula sp.]|uniref:zinc ribbon domain-containing protein n=1 Tax=uncultured Methanoregula sp. TaxID=1005933 RepID=UPI002AAB1B64|nr:zinc ribbon domain-containing protein [uncultured Methanoregula sp.]
MKCPHCGMNIRDNIVECGYCGGKIAKRPEKPSAAPARSAVTGGVKSTGASQKQNAADDAEMEDEDGGGLSGYLQPGEQVLVGSLNVSVKKFFFHAYLTNQRVFLIDTQEKKLKVTAKDVPRDTIAGSIVEFSENSDPVLVLSIRSADDEIKTMKLVFAQNGTDRSREIDEWIALLQEAEPPKKSRKPPVEEPAEPEAPEEEPEEYEEEPPAPVRPVKPPVRQELYPARKPVKDHERQPPVKRILSPYRIPEEEPEPVPEPEVVVPQRRSQPQIRQVAEPVRRSVISSSNDQDNSPVREPAAPQVRKPEVQSAMKVAMKGAVRPLTHPASQPVRRMVAQPVQAPEPEHEFEPEPEVVRPPVRRPVTREVPAERQQPEEQPADGPQFCHNCGKKLPQSANFCPGCGTNLGPHRTLPHTRPPATQSDKRMTRTDPPVHEQRAHRESGDSDEEDEIGEVPVPTKPPVKKAPKGSEMTILHKFLRR